MSATNRQSSAEGSKPGHSGRIAPGPPGPETTGTPIPWINMMILSPMVTLPPLATRSRPPAIGAQTGVTAYPFATPTGSTMGLTTVPPGLTTVDVPETARPSLDTNDTRVRTLIDEGGQ